MGSARKGATRKAGKAARAAGSNPYIQRVVQDAELREDMREALDRTRSAYERLANGKAPVKALMEDKKLQRELREAATSLRDVGISLRDGPKRKKRRLGRMVLVGIVGAGLALALSEGLRKKVLDALFGAEEEFEYTSTTTPSPTPTPAAA